MTEPLLEALARAVDADPHGRVLHRKGVWVRGSFAGAATAPAVTRATLLDGVRHDVLARFSGTRSAPGAHDATSGEVSLAVRIGGAASDGWELSGFTLPVFFVRSGADLVAMLTAFGEDARAGTTDRTEAFLLAHPEARTAYDAQAALEPTSYATATYRMVHAYGLVDAAGALRRCRLSWQPVDPGPETTPDDRAFADYLTEDLLRRLPVRFRLVARLAAPGDPVDDPTAAWSPDGTDVVLGTLEIDEVVDPAPSPEPHLDPARLPDGVAPPGDRLFADRLAVYAAARRARGADLRPPASPGRA